MEERYIRPPPERWFSYDAWRWVRVAEYWIRVRLCGQQTYLIDRWTVIEDNIDPGYIQIQPIPSNQLDDSV
jgi:hypothetical protein